MKKFLEYSKKIVPLLNNSNSQLNIVLGNETCDLDSSICSITYAYYLQQIKPDKQYLPILNIEEREFHLRPELHELLSHAEINNVNLFVFRDQLDLSKLSSKKLLNVILVDHHVMRTEDEVTLRDAVVEILDHRPIVKQPGEKVKYLIEPVGSCASLVAEFMLNDSNFVLTKEIAILLYGAIIIDTVALSEKVGRTTPKDLLIVKQLKKQIDLQFDDQLFYQRLHHVKISASHFTTVDLLKKDLKKVVNSLSTFSIAITVIMQKLEEIFSRPHILEDIIEFTAQSQSLACIIIFMNVPDQGDVTRQLAIYSQKDLLRNEIARHLMESKDPNLELQTIKSGINSNLIVAFNQINIKVTRKAILPIIDNNIDALEKL